MRVFKAGGKTKWPFEANCQHKSEKSRVQVQISMSTSTSTSTDSHEYEYEYRVQDQNFDEYEYEYEYKEMSHEYVLEYGFVLESTSLKITHDCDKIQTVHIQKSFVVPVQSHVVNADFTNISGLLKDCRCTNGLL